MKTPVLQAQLEFRLWLMRGAAEAMSFLKCNYTLLNGCCGPSWIATRCPARDHCAYRKPCRVEGAMESPKLTK
jgi:hypothetical protein